jgi:DMSO/TMAO reductase YedYZ molybdopterin-dependent catalytic subunit
MPSAAKLRRVPLAVLLGLLVHYLCAYTFHTPLFTQTIAEWIMARTPSRYAVLLLTTLGPWAKPFAMTAGLALLGFTVSIATLIHPLIGVIPAALALGWAFDYWSLPGQLSFWVPAITVLLQGSIAPISRRREFLTMLAGFTAVAFESWARDRQFASHAKQPVDLFPFQPPSESFGQGLVRKAVTPIPEFYGMSKNSVDPVLDPADWRLKITQDGRQLRQLSFDELLALPRTVRYVTLRCISNTLQSDLMGTAAFSGFGLAQIVDRTKLPPSIVEVAVIGSDGHGDSFPLDYAFSDEALFALGMNGKTLDRTHGFPLRLLSPRYYGFKNVKWISEIAFVSKPYYGTWPKLGYTKQPLIHTASHIDRVRKENGEIQVGGVSFAGVHSIQNVQLRADQGPWQEAELEKPLSPYTWTRWVCTLPSPPATAKVIEARAQDDQGRWQESAIGSLFPDGLTGPTIRRLD